MPEPTTPQLTESDVEAIEARANAATGGPWTAYHRISPRGAYKQWHVGNKDGLCQITMSGHERDYQFMAHARTDIPALIRDWRALQAENDTLKDELKVADDALENQSQWMSESRAELAQLQSENAALREQLVQITGERDGLKRRIQEMRDERR